MKILLIFNPDDNPDEGLWALKYKENTADEFNRLINAWMDPEIMYQFCLDNQSDVQIKFGHPIDAKTAADELMEEADALIELLYNLGKKLRPGTNLQHLFKPLDNSETNLTELQLSKAFLKDRAFRNPKLRIYAIRVGVNTYVVTGGAIKLTDKMNERAHTDEQLRRLRTARDWLKREGISYPEDLNNLL